MKRFLVFFMVVGLMAGALATAEAKKKKPKPEPTRVERTVEASYMGPFVWSRICAPPGGAGCVNIETRANERFLTAKAMDAHGQPVSVWVVDSSEARDDNGAGTVYGHFCGETTEPIRFDPGTTLELWIGGEWWPTWWIVPEVDCSPGIATTGTISVTLSNLA